MKVLYNVVPTCLVSMLVMLGAPSLSAQIMNPITARINHSFVIANTTLPPGKYTFEMQHGSDLQVMTARSSDEKTVVEFLVGDAIDSHTPNHSVLIFKKYGNTEFLSRIFESGSKSGASIADVSRQEERLKKQGQLAREHSEEQN